jgi:hypothetical protein
LKEAKLIRDAWLASGEYKSAKEINSGKCGPFATRLLEILGKGEIIYGSNFYDRGYSLKRNRLDYHGHCVLLLNDKLYDVENPEGVSHPDELTFYKRLHKEIYG